MLLNRWSKRFYESTRGRIVGLLRRGTLTVDQIATSLGLTGNAVRAQLTTLERDGLVEQRIARQGGVGKPAFAYRITSDADRLFSRAYIPVLAQLLDVLGERIGRSEMEGVMRTLGTRLAAQAAPPTGSPRERLDAAARFLEELGGGADIEEREGTFFIRGFSCPLGATVVSHPEMCVAIETMLSDLIGSPAHECCNRGDRPQCGFRIDLPIDRTAGTR